MANGDLWVCQEITSLYFSLIMSTSIISIYTREGFVVAADGRKYNTDTKRVVSDDTQKIFPIEQPGRELVYAISGTVELTEPGSAEVVFDFAKEINLVVNGLANERLDSLWHYAEALSKALVNLPVVSGALAGDELPTVIYLNGYYGNRPKRAQITLFHDGQVPEVSTRSLTPGFPDGLGSQLIAHNLLRYDLVANRCLSNPDSINLADAVEIAKSWMAAHSAPEAVSVDPACVSIGGTVLISTITSTDGFRWVQGPTGA
jgi:hypothetical protein